MWFQRASSSLYRPERVCVFLAPRTPEFSSATFCWFCFLRRSLHPDLSYAWCILLSLSPNRTGVASWHGSVRFPLPGREASIQPLVWVSDNTSSVRRSSLACCQLCMLAVRVCWRPESDFRRKGCLSGLRKRSQTNKPLAGPWGSPLCPVTTPTTNSSVLLPLVGQINTRNR